MRLYFLDPTSRAAVNITSLRNSGYETRRIIAWEVKGLDSLIVIGNGTPDDKVIGVLSHYLDGNTVTGVVKPKEKMGLSAIDRLKTYLDSKINKIMVLIDQENRLLREFFDEALERLTQIGIDLTVEEEEMNRLRVCRCSLAGKRFEVIIVVNGLDDISTEKHTIEDHLIKSAGIEAKGSSKNSWNSLSKNEREEVFRKLKGKRGIIEDLFPQQVIGCKRLRNRNE